MSDILERLAGLGVTKGFPSCGSRTVRKTADAVAMLKTKFPDAIVSENRYGEVFNVRSHFPLSGRIGTAPLSAPFRHSPRLDAVLSRGIYLLSNAGLRFERACTRIPCWSLMDGWVVSAFERLMKPDPSIYLLLCDRYGLEPSSCLFVDDNEDNVIGARAAGLAAYLSH